VIAGCFGLSSFEVLLMVPIGEHSLMKEKIPDENPGNYSGEISD
jgi:hypothetical protein